MLDKLISYISSNFTLKILSLGIAIVLWLVVLNSMKSEIIKDVLVEFDLPQDVIMDGDIPDHISFKLSGPKVFLKNIANRKDKIRLDFSKAKVGNLTHKISQDILSLPFGVKVLAITPSQVNVKLEKVKSKEILVKPIFIENLPQGFKLIEAKVEPKTVFAKGSEFALRNLEEAKTSQINLSEIKDSQIIETKLDNLGKNIFFEPSSVKINFRIEAETSNFKINNVGVFVSNPDPKFQLITTNVSIFVKTSGAFKGIQKISEDSIKVIANTRKIKQGEVTPEIQLPQGMTLIKVEPSKIKFKNQ